jgi:hypothetical protein
MSGQTGFFTTAALLERAYRLAYVLQSEGWLEIQSRQFVVNELVKVLDEARVSLFAARGLSTQV